jgi:hypothetical protein
MTAMASASKALIFGVAAALMAVASAMPASAFTARAQAAPDSQPGARAPEKPAMSFRLGRLPSTPPCGSAACADFIVAEGNIVSMTPILYEVVIKRLEGRKVPLYLHSSGGSVRAGMRLGEAFRAREQTVIVASRKQAPCAAGDAACAEADPTLRVAPFIPGEAGLCASACVLALAGGAQRQVPTEARIGVHQYFQRDDETRRPRQSYTQAEVGSFQRTMVEAAQYLTRMGVGLDVLLLGSDTPPDKVRMLSRPQLVATGLHRPVAAPAPPAEASAGAPAPAATPSSPLASAVPAIAPAALLAASPFIMSDTPWIFTYDLQGRPQLARTVAVPGGAEGRPLGALSLTATCDPAKGDALFTYGAVFRPYPGTRPALVARELSIAGSNGLLHAAGNTVIRRQGEEWQLQGFGAATRARDAAASARPWLVRFGFVDRRAITVAVGVGGLPALLQRFPGTCFAGL